MTPVPDRSKNFRGTANPEYIEAMRQIRRSSASSPHKSPDEKGSRQANKQKAIKESRNG